jgi:hypothetical protein
MCGDDGRRANATKNGCGAMLSGIAQAKAIYSSSRGHGRSMSTTTDNNNNAMYGNNAAHKNKASATTTPHVMTRLRVAFTATWPRTTTTPGQQ